MINFVGVDVEKHRNNIVILYSRFPTLSKLFGIDKDDEDEEEDEQIQTEEPTKQDPVPFTVVRVSSSVSQVRPSTDEPVDFVTETTQRFV